MTETAGQQEEQNMFALESHMAQAVLGLAKTMIASGDTVIDYVTPEGNLLFSISTDKESMKSVLFKMVVDDTTVYIGEKKAVT
jgi:hypothetical protein